MLTAWVPRHINTDDLRITDLRLRIEHACVKRQNSGRPRGAAALLRLYPHQYPWGERCASAARARALPMHIAPFFCTYPYSAYIHTSILPHAHSQTPPRPGRRSRTSHSRTRVPRPPPAVAVDLALRTGTQCVYTYSVHWCRVAGVSACWRRLIAWA